MNYLKQIRDFSDRRRLFPLRATSIAMYYVLLEHFNQSRFPPAMPIPAAILAGELGVTEATIRNCRRELLAKGYIGLTSGGRNAEYRILPIGCQYPTGSLDFRPLDTAASQTPFSAEGCGGDDA